MVRPTGTAACAALLLAATLLPPDARADCHWAWHCDGSGQCGLVPFCDSPDDTPPPLRGARLPGDEKRTPLPPGVYAARKPLPGYKPVNPPPGGTRLDRRGACGTAPGCPPQQTEGSDAAPPAQR